MLCDVTVDQWRFMLLTAALVILASSALSRSGAWRELHYKMFVRRTNKSEQSYVNRHLDNISNSSRGSTRSLTLLLQDVIKILISIIVSASPSGRNGLFQARDADQQHFTLLLSGFHIMNQIFA